MKNKKSFLFIFLGLLAVGGLVLSFFLSKEFTKPVEEDSSISQEESHNEELNKTMDSEENERLSNLDTEATNEEPKKSTDSIYQVPKLDQEVIDLPQSKHYEQQARAKFRELRFLEGANFLQDITKQYSNEGAGDILHQLYFEGSLLANVIPPPDRAYEGEIAEGEGVYNIMSIISDPEMLLLGVIGLDPVERANVIIHKGSLNPIFFGQVFIQDKTVEEGEMLNKVHILYPEIETLHRIHFVIEGYHLYAYIMQYPDGTSKLHSIQEVTEGTTPYKTIQEWDELYKELNIKPTSERENRY